MTARLWNNMNDHCSTTSAVVKLTCDINSGLNGIQTPQPMQNLCNALPTEISSQFGAGHVASS